MRYITVLLAVASVVGAAEKTVVLTDFDTPGTWEVSKWSKAPARLAVRPESPPQLADKGPGKALGVKVDWPGGGGFHFVNIVPADGPVTLDHRVLSLSVYLKGAGTQHFLHATLVDAKGEERKADLGRLDATRWQKREFKIPADWPQPLKLKGFSLHDWGVGEPTKVTVYLARAELAVDPTRKPSGELLAPPDPKPLPRVKLPGAARVLSDFNLPGEWTPEPWNKASGTMRIVDDFPDELEPVPGGMRRSLELDLRFAGKFQFYSIHPPEPIEIPYRLQALQIWVKGPRTKHSLEVHFKASDGKGVKVGAKGGLNFAGWQQLTMTIPKYWPQPLRLTGVTLHNFSYRQPAEIAPRITRLVVGIDPKKYLGGLDELHATDDDW